MKNYYKILGVKSDATEKEIKDAYDVRLGLQENFPASWTEERKKDLDDAYDTLIDPTSRSRYDKQLREFEALRREPERVTTSRNLYPTERKAGEKILSDILVAWYMRRPIRRTVALAILLIWLAAQLFGGDSDDSSNSDHFSSSNSPSSFQFSTRAPNPTRRSFSSSRAEPTATMFPTRTPDYAELRGALTQVAQENPEVELRNIRCTGKTIRTTYEYDNDRDDRIRSISPRTELEYRPTDDIEWIQIYRREYAGYVHAADVSVLSCEADTDS